MAPSLKASGTWATATADTAATLVGSPAAGDRHYLWVTWKPYTVTCSVSGWTEVTEYADGAVADGDGVGSVKVACYYRDWQSGDGNPTIDFSASPSIAGYVMQLWQKGAGEVFDTPTFSTGPRGGGGTASSAVASAPISVPSGAVVFLLIGLRDDSATFTRNATTALTDQTSAVTWNGSYVESPATHLTTTTGNDLSADLGHRFVTTGATANNLVGNLTTSAAESGAALWVIQTVSAAPPSDTGAFFAFF